MHIQVKILKNRKFGINFLFTSLQQNGRNFGTPGVHDMKFGQNMSKRHKIKVLKFELDCVFRKKVIAKKLKGGGHIEPPSLLPVQIGLSIIYIYISCLVFCYCS